LVNFSLRRLKMIGIDIVQNDRIRKAIEKFGDRFINRIYTKKEIDYCNSQKDSIPCLSARWACKEAVIKAVFQETGVLLKFKEVEVNGNRGMPARVVIRNDKALKMLGEKRVIVSISHERNHSVAVAFIR